ncbi:MULTISPECIES: ANTAR domain-containing protein [Streptomyces]|uniref:ANTAR domain-containing protein n=1 Tax=Streptomyces edwardsiae TaxID=3075527 RepID=A0ABU2PNU9_9ACTN|nr:ANTAR domain-containing protein [Streptomyces sp. DSM 41636]MDT0393836.1 ANTAR domain-containing protein [Streptomyces sp. DSM 41636]
MVIGGRTDAGRALLTPRGELVRGCAQVLAAKLAELPAGTARVDVDMSGVYFMDTGGLEFLEVLRDHGRRRSVPVTATRWNGQPRRVLELAGLDTTDPLRPAQEQEERLLLLQEEVEQLRQAIASRPVIDQARGILMATYGCTSDEAWHILREASQLSNTKLRTVAESLTASAAAQATPPPEDVRAALSRALARRSLR